MQTLTVTPCTLDDVHTLQDIALQAYGDHYLYLWHDGGAWYVEKSFSEAVLKEELQDPNVAMFLLYAAQELVGFLKLNIDKALGGEEASESLELERIYLTKRASGQGLGRQAIAFTVAFARERQKRQVWLKAMDSSPSVNFYTQNGFETCGTHTLEFEPMKEEYRGMVVMRRAI